jgi:hypothetical protein
MTKRSVVVLLDENKKVVAAMDSTITHKGISHEIAPRPGQTLLEVEIPEIASDLSPADFKNAIGEAMKSPTAVKPWKSERSKVGKKHE